MKRTVPKTTLVLVILLASLLPTQTKASTKEDISLASVYSVWNTLIDQISDVFLPIFYTNPQIVINPVSHPLSVGTLNPEHSTTTQTIIRNITNVQTLSQSDLDQITNTLRQQLQSDANTYASNAAGHAVDSLGRNQVVNGNIATGGNGTFTGTIEATDLSSSHGLVLPSYTPLDTTNLLYNTDDSLYWRGSVIAGSAVGTWSQSNGNVYRTTGNVGIGTNDPAEPLHIKSDLWTLIKLENNLDQGAGVMFTTDIATGEIGVNGSGDGNPGELYVWNYATKPIRFGTAGVERMKIDESGNVGIGTTTPIVKLSVAGDVYSTGDLVAKSLTTSDTQVTSSIAGVSFNNGYISNASRLFGAGNEFGLYDQSVSFGMSLSNRFPINWSSSGVFYGTPDVGLARGNAGQLNVTNGSNGLGTLIANNVGIGTTSPSTALDVNGVVSLSSSIRNSTVGGTLSFLRSDNVSLMTLDSSGTLSTGGQINSNGHITLPASSLFRFSGRTMLQSNADGNLVMFNSAGNGFGLLQLGGFTSSYPALGRNGTSIYTALADGTLGGSFGIGTTTPWGKLSVNPDALGSGVPEFVVGSSTATHFIVNGAGNVGVGNISPAYKLDIASNAIGTGSTVGLMLANNTTVTSGAQNQYSPVFSLRGRQYGTFGNPMYYNGDGFVDTRFQTVGSIGGNGRVIMNTNIQGVAMNELGGDSVNYTLRLGGVVSAGDSTMKIGSGGSFSDVLIQGDKGSIGFLTGGESGRLAKASITYVDNGSGWNRGDLYFLQNSAAGANNLSLSDVKMVIANAGNVGIGTTTPTAQLSTTGSVRFANFGAGTLQTDANGNLSVSSDERLKNIQGNFTTGLSAIEELNPINYKWKVETGYDTEHTYTGFSAQNVQLSIPEAVSVDSRGFLTLQDRPILATLVNAVKELSKMVENIGTTLRDKVVEIREAVVGTLRINDKICVDDVCISKDQFKQMLLKSGASAGTANLPQTNTDASTTQSESSTTTITTASSTENTNAENLNQAEATTTPDATPEESNTESGAVNNTDTASPGEGNSNNQVENGTPSGDSGSNTDTSQNP